MRCNRSALIVVLAILLLFFFQALSDLIQSIYAFGLLVTAFTPQLAAVLLLFSPVGLLFVRQVPSRRWLIGLGAVAVLARLIEPMLDPGGRLVACGFSVGAFMLLWPLMVEDCARRRAPTVALRGYKTSQSAGWGLLLAVMLSVLFRTAGSSVDISEVGFTQVIAWVLAGSAAWLARRYAVVTTEIAEPSTRRLAPYVAPRGGLETPESGPMTHEDRRAESLRSLAAGPKAEIESKKEIATSPGSRYGGTTPPTRPLAPRNDNVSGRGIGLCIGLAAVLVMIYFSVVSAGVMARWTGASYEGVVGAAMLAWTAFAFLLRGRLDVRRVPRAAVGVWNGAFVAMLVLSILPQQVAFPADQQAYPFIPPAVSPVWQIPVYLMIVLSPVIFVDFMLFVRGLSAERPSVRQLGGGFALGALFLLVMVFLQVFTTIYDYAKPIGPLFRDRFWLVYLIAGLAMAGPVWLAGDRSHAEEGDPWVAPTNADSIGAKGGRAGKERDTQPDPSTAGGRQAKAGMFPAWAALGLAVLTGMALWLSAPRLGRAGESNGMMRVMTYNIQQGFDRVGNAALPNQLAAIRRVDPDILGLEESDTARVANGNVDAVRYFANKLGMYSYYGPPTTVGTFGVALLSRYPIQRAWTFYMYSTGEQTACIEAVITANGKTYNVFVTHLGNGGPMVQLLDVLNRAVKLPNVILMGDLNFDPSTNQYALATQTLSDAWLLRWPSGRQLTGPGAEGRIDQIFVSPDTQVSEAEYVPDPASDHPYLYAVVK